MKQIDNIPSLGPSPYPDIPSSVFDVSGIIKLLANINSNKANGPDLIQCWVLKEAAAEITPFLQFLYTQSVATGQLPADWQKANITPVSEKGDKHQPANYRPISLTAMPCKILEHIIFHDIMAHLDSMNILIKSQHGFRRKLSCETQLVTTIEEIGRALDNGNQSDLIIMDFSKAFDTVPHQRLISKLDYYGIRGNLKSWITTWLTCGEQSVVIDGLSSPAVHASSGVPQGTVLGPLMLLLYINDIGDNCNSAIRLFADDTILYSIIESTLDAGQLQLDLSTIEQWAKKWLMQFNPNKCFVMRVTRKSHPIIFDYKLMGHTLESASHYPYLEVELSSSLDWSHHIDMKTNKANRTLGFLKRNLGKCPESIKELSYKSLVRPHLEYARTVWDPWKDKHINQIEAV
ncbi:putative RNA-directed DNA polymerase from transposon X-element [Stylophora pistillata]|uniref:Putative RNA-directed DNA polymerase from transposon X-element n=1 Tax=Stylophora pistillata TaxID=50429 RepID=A0A2B4RF95_STYPI|nr:putative RNA-directed DNA polymerase from transposon X-element [Stylophora pistillata]